MLKLIAAFTLSLGFASAAMADEKPYKDGPVTQVSFIRVKDGKMFDYLSYLSNTYKKEMEGYKKAGLILEYKIFQSQPHSPTDANVILTVVYPNYAAFDRTAEFDAVDVKLSGSLKAADASFGERDSIRDVLGTDILQEMILK